VEVKKSVITFAASAIKDLEDMQAYYLGEGVPDVGKRLTSEIVSKIERLAAHPLIFPPFRIVYRHDKNRVRIVRIWRSERLPKQP
jgi:toxin ParE1/3/4